MQPDYKTVTTIPSGDDFKHYDTLNKKIVSLISRRGNVCIVCDEQMYRYPVQDEHIVEKACFLIPEEVKPEVKAPPPPPVFRNDLPTGEPKRVAPKKAGKKKNEQTNKLF